MPDECGCRQAAYREMVRLQTKGRPPPRAARIGAACMLSLLRLVITSLIMAIPDVAEACLLSPASASS